MCKLEYLSHILRKSSTQIYAICVSLNIFHTFCVKVAHNMCNYIAFRFVFKKIYAADEKIYATAGPTGPAKYQLWFQVVCKCLWVKTKKVDWRMYSRISLHKRAHTSWRVELRARNFRTLLWSYLHFFTDFGIVFVFALGPFFYIQRNIEEKMAKNRFSAIKFGRDALQPS